MKTDPLRTRWSDPSYVSQAVAPILEHLVGDKRLPDGTDLRGVTIGLDGAVPEFLHATFHGVAANRMDASKASLATSFSESHLVDCRFTGTFFDTCLFLRARLERCDFSEVKLAHARFDDAAVDGCSFVNARLTGKAMGPYGGRRTVFVNCDFTGATFDKLELRACRFRSCRFDGAVFKKCLLAGTKFEDGAPSDQAFVGCER